MDVPANDALAAAAASAPRLGAEVDGDGVRFEVWAPRAASVDVQIEGDPPGRHRLSAGSGHTFSGRVRGIGANARYRFVLDGGRACPDPRSRFQPEGPHGPSMVVDPSAYAWHDGGWAGAVLAGQVIYELHVGTFTQAGTFDAAAQELPYLRDLGITMIEVMPIAEFPGRFNWGYDGVDLYAPFHGYGDPEAFKRFVDAAHAHGLAVILDVVYNHLGCDGNYLDEFAGDYFTDRYANEWGRAINFDGPSAGPVREFFAGNACYWVREFHVDGLRLDATQSMHDASGRHVIRELVERARSQTPRSLVFIAENEPQRAEHLLPPAQGGFGLDGMWNDDFHHSARVALTGRHDGYFHDHRGRATEFVAGVRHGFLFQGQYYQWQKKPRGSRVTTQAPWAFVIFLQNHDQVANTLDGLRLPALCNPARYRALTALLLLAPQTPLLFMGQEFAASAPFPFFADHGDELGRAAHEGRRQFVAQFEAYATPESQARVSEPRAEQTFQRAKLDFSERERHAPMLALHKDLLALRRLDPVIGSLPPARPEAAVISESAFVLRWQGGQHGDRLLVVNLGADLYGEPMPEPLLAPAPDCDWTLEWSSESSRYGGLGVRAADPREGWNIAGECACLYRCARKLPA